MKRPPKVDGGTMHGRDMTQQVPTDRMAFSAPLVHNLLEMMRGPRHGYIGQQGKRSGDGSVRTRPNNSRNRYG